MDNCDCDVKSEEIATHQAALTKKDEQIEGLEDVMATKDLYIAELQQQGEIRHLHNIIDDLEAKLEKAENHIFECCVADGCDCGYEAEIPDLRQGG